jgi:hypothetical protein
LNEKVTHCQQAVNYALASKDDDTLVSSYLELAVAYKYIKEPDLSFWKIALAVPSLLEAGNATRKQSPSSSKICLRLGSVSKGYKELVERYRLNHEK